MSAKVYRLLIADDHALFREGLKQLFSFATDIQVVAEASNAWQVLDCLQANDVDLLLLDMSMPGPSGGVLISRIVALENSPPVLVVSMHNEIQMVRKALSAGASGYMTKDCHPDALLNAIRRVAEGGRCLDPSLAQELAFESAARPVRQLLTHSDLSDREFEVFMRLANGMTVGDIAEELAISNKTVSTYKARVMDKLSFSSQADIIRYAIEQGLVLA